MRRAPAAGLAAAVITAAVGCGAPPWRMGAPLDGRPAIPPGQARPSVDTLHAEAAAARAAGRPVLELSALAVLDEEGRLRGGERQRLVALLVARAEAFADMGRAIPESDDLEAAARLDAARGAALASTRAAAAAAAGDAWKAIGAKVEARNAYARAAWLGGVPAASLPAAPIPAGALPAAPPPAARPKGPPPDIEGWVLAGPALSSRLLPLAAAYPWVLDDVPRALGWAELLLAEDPTSPDVRELVALIFGRARRFGGTSRMLMELAYYSPDRAAGLARGAAVWDRLGRRREACAQWIRAARWRRRPRGSDLAHGRRLRPPRSRGGRLARDPRLRGQPSAPGSPDGARGGARRRRRVRGRRRCRQGCSFRRRPEARRGARRRFGWRGGPGRGREPGRRRGPGRGRGPGRVFRSALATACREIRGAIPWQAAPDPPLRVHKLRLVAGHRGEHETSARIALCPAIAC